MTSPISSPRARRGPHVLLVLDWDRDPPIGLAPVRPTGRPSQKRPSLSTGRAHPSVKLISKVARRTGPVRRRVTAVFDGPKGVACEILVPVDIPGHGIIATATRFNKSLYAVNAKPVHYPPDQANLAKAIPDLATWHPRLAHANIPTIIHMAKKKMATDQKLRA
ncbi:hypothetical protein B0H10DRAFT_2242180 [Mycena sp. CBHHK59/15]|nr:hypothetical protein B0H10DRAFT_2242180 [Mycena sp. CBHHK59/15]